ncbi:flagellar biosynthesis protein FlhB [Amantichitinum ursilacus]|uniref:Flagellar biosynthetic protein FlhB n=1 Tax=Amantichitinum ursilacus TaxID=857265 RepID=A0A0N0XIP0_9NEIS|nr:flagellar biosynthesis protein FlhB [Amantichitinum ursilacus]KPC50265.1 Flagellar biosynthetic protein FlhB [Amantichitinum ursilacus]
MAEDSDAEKTEPASGKRLEEARQKGQVPRSQELGSFAIMITGMLAMVALGPKLAIAIEQICRRELTFNHATVSDPQQMFIHFMAAGQQALFAFLPIAGACVAVALISPMAIGGFLFTGTAFAPNFGRLNPASGIGRMFSVRALVEAGKAILKTGLIGGVAVTVLWREKDQFLQLIVMPTEVSMAYVLEMVRYTLLLVIGSMGLIAAIDVPYQLWDYYKKLRMTKEEAKQESKESDGDPQIKARIRQMQRQAARRRMMQQIPKADVVVTNPTHYAVALQYNERMRAPKVVAKGSYLLAERIIDLARESNVTVIRTPPFARALYHHTDLDEEIPAALYTAAAEVLAYIYQLKNWKREGGTEPTLNDDLPVPTELDPEATTA